MNKALKLILFFCIIGINLCLAIPSKSYATQDLGGFIIKNFNSDIKVNDDSSLNITEEIDTLFSSPRHGIYRYLPLIGEIETTSGPSVDKKLNILINSITVDGNPIEYTTEVNHDSNFNLSNKLFGLYYDSLVIRIGDPNITVEGEVKYVINYSVFNALYSNGSKTSLLWSVTGNGWNVPIDNVHVNVTSFSGINNINCFYGRLDSTNKCDSNLKNKNATATVSSLGAREGLTINSDLNASSLDSTVTSTTFSDYADLIGSHFISFLFIISPLFIFIFIFLIWLTHRAPKGSGVIIPYYDAPDGLHPAQVGYIYDESIDDVDYGATIIDLSIKGYMKIEYLKDSGDYLFHKLERNNELLAYEKILYDGLFKEGNDILLSSLKNIFYMTLSSVKTELNIWIVDNKYFRSSVDKNSTIISTICLFFFILILAIAVSTYMNLGMSFIIGFIIFVVITIVPDIALIYFLNHKTIKGVLEKEKIIGLKQYINLAEKERLNMLNPPQLTSELFEKLLPYAMVLGLSEQWAKQFQNIYVAPPNWYQGNFDNFSTILLISSLSNATTDFNSVLASTPSTSSSMGGGGFGGSVGGGFGGGGGGSW